VYNIKYLGINFDHRLKFTDHIYSVNNSIRKLFYKFKILRNILDLKTLRVVFLALAQSIIYMALWSGDVHTPVILMYYVQL